MEVLDKINKKLKEALNNGDKKIALVMRSLIAEIRNKEIDLKGRGSELTEEDVIQVIKKEAKKRNDAIDLYREGGRNDLVENEEAELKILEEFLPKQMSDEELRKIVEDVIESSEDKNFGLIMKEVMKRVGGSADGSRVSAIVKEKLK